MSAARPRIVSLEDFTVWRAEQRGNSASDHFEVFNGPAGTAEEWSGFLSTIFPNAKPDFIEEEATRLAAENADATEEQAKTEALMAEAIAKTGLAKPRSGTEGEHGYNRVINEAVHKHLNRFLSRTVNRQRRPAIDLEDLLAEPDAEDEYAVQDYIGMGTFFQPIGKKSSFKSMALIDLCIQARIGGTWLGKQVTAMHVVYISNEKTRRSVKNRFRRLTPPDYKPTKSARIWHRTSLQVHPDDEDWKELVAYVAGLNDHCFVVIDTLTSATPADSKENEDVSQKTVLAALDMLTSLPVPATVLPSQHTAKYDKGGAGATSRGHTLLPGAADGSIIFQRDTVTSNTGVIHVVPKDGEYAHLAFRFDPDTLQIAVETTATGTPATNTEFVRVTSDLQSEMAPALPTIEDIQTAFGTEPDPRSPGKQRFRFSVPRLRSIAKDEEEVGRIKVHRERQSDDDRKWRYEALTPTPTSGAEQEIDLDDI